MPLWSCGIEEASRVGAEEGALLSDASESVELEFVDVKSGTVPPFPSTGGVSVVPAEVEFPAAGSFESVLKSESVDPVEAEPLSSVEVMLVAAETVPDTPFELVESGEVVPESDVVVFDAAATSFPGVAEPVDAAATAVCTAAAERLTV